MMGAVDGAELNAMLSEVRAGCAGAQDRLIQAIYDDLRHIAGGLMRGERRAHSLAASDLVDEALLRLLDGQALTEISDGRLLYAAAIQAMRQVLVDHARRRKAGKRGGNWARIPLDDVLARFEAQGLDFIDLDEALGRLAESYPRQARVVELRFLGEMSVLEVAETLGFSTTTVEADWRFARAWLRGRLGGMVS
jgi:RNA polymerase sigma-70 factor, ECF subfamily